jgi:hypothetical protein
MSIKLFFAISVITLFLLESFARAEVSSEFDENVIRNIQDARVPSQEFNALVQEFESSNDPVVKSEKWRELIAIASEGLLSVPWTAPAGGWKLLDFPTEGGITLREVSEQPSTKVSFTKIVAKNEAAAVQLRGAGALLSTAISSGEQWACKMLLNAALHQEGNFKHLTYWFAKNFGEDANEISWTVDWNEWHNAYGSADVLGKSIVLRNVTMLAIRSNEFAVARSINLAALSSSERELKAIALAFGHPDLGLDVTTKWREIAEDASDPQIRALARETLTKFGM